MKCVVARLVFAVLAMSVVSALAAGRAFAAPGRQGPDDEPAPDDLRGAWLVEGSTSVRCLTGLGDVVSLDGAWDGLGALRLAGTQGAGRAVLGPARPGGEGDVRVEVAAAEGGVAVVVRRGGQVVARERWLRPGPARLAVAADVHGEGYDPTQDGPLELRVRVGGRPQAIRVRVQAQGEGAYAALGGVVHEDLLADGARQALGERTIVWSGHDRGFPGDAVVPGTYVVVVEGADDAIGPPPARRGRVADGPARAELVLQVVRRREGSLGGVAARLEGAQRP